MRSFAEATGTRVPLGSDILDLSDRLFECLPIAVCVCDSVGRIVRYNRRASELWDHSPALRDPAVRFCGSSRMYAADGTPTAHADSPMADVLRTGTSIRNRKILMERPNGSRRVVIANIDVLEDELGRRVGAVGCFDDITEENAPPASASEISNGVTLGSAEHNAQLLAAIVESSDDAFLSENLDGIIASWNRGAERLFGYRAEETIGKPVTVIIPKDRLDEETEILSRIRRGDRIDHYETIRRRKDGSLVEISLTVSPLRDGRGNIVGVSKIAHDITENRRAQDQQQLLLREMNHRIRNLFALSSGVVALSARSATTLPELVKAVRERLGALARAHSLTLTDVSGGGNRAEQATTMYALIQAILSPFGSEKDANDRVSISGPDIEIAEASVASLALLLHEFATNAAKYGALSTSAGRIIVECLETEDDYLLIWNERGGPPIDREVESEGFGSLLARTTVESHLGGRLQREWNPEGLAIRLTVPRDRLRREDGISPGTA
jgi:PAS domain S-box-containing protein